MSKKSLSQFTSEELIEALNNESKRVVYCANDYVSELSRRSAEKQAKAINYWTAVIAIATLVNTIATILLILNTIKVY